MWKFVGALVIAVTSFALGYYFGQRPVGTLEQTVGDLQSSLKEMWRNGVDTTMGIERDLRQTASLARYEVSRRASKIRTLRQEFRRGGETIGGGCRWPRKRNEGC